MISGLGSNQWFSPFTENSPISRTISSLFNDAVTAASFVHKKNMNFWLATTNSYELDELSIALVEMGADVDICSGISDTPLYAAVARGNVTTVRILLAHGANPNRECFHGYPLKQAVENGDLELTRILLESGAFPLPSALNHAIENGNRDIIDLFLEYNVDPNVLGEFATPLYVAVMAGEFEIAQLLLDRGADIQRAKTIFGFTLLEGLIGKPGNREALIFALEAGADPDFDPQTIAFGRTLPIRKAVSSGDLGALRLLLDYGADPNCHLERPSGYSPLHHAVNFLRQEIIKILLDRNVSVDVENRRGKTPFLQVIEQAYATNSPELRRNNLRIARLLSNRGADVLRALETARTLGSSQQVIDFLVRLEARRAHRATRFGA